MIPSMAAFLLHCSMILNGILLFDEPNQKMLTAPIKREIVNIVNIVKKKKIYLNNHHDFIGYVSGRETVTVDPEICGGYCSLVKNVIAIAENQSAPISVLCHELGHHIQNKLGLFDLNAPLSFQVKMEHQAETIAYNLYSALVDRNISHRLFNTYFNIEDIKWLNDYYEGWYENDLF